MGDWAAILERWFSRAVKGVPGSVIAVLVFVMLISISGDQRLPDDSTAVPRDAPGALQPISGESEFVNPTTTRQARQITDTYDSASVAEATDRPQVPSRFEPGRVIPAGARCGNYSLLGPNGAYCDLAFTIRNDSDFSVSDVLIQAEVDARPDYGGWAGELTAVSGENRLISWDTAEETIRVHEIPPGPHALRFCITSFHWHDQLFGRHDAYGSDCFRGVFYAGT